MALVELREVTKQFPLSKGKDAQALAGKTPSITVIDGVNLDVNEGEIFGLIGYSGAGKSTLVRLINALTPVTSGSIKIGGTEITDLSERKLQVLRRNVGMVFQQFNLFNSRTVSSNIAFPLTVAGIPKTEHPERVSNLLDFVGLTDKANAYPDELSGGQKQRVGIARALATNPQLLLADEATSALDPDTTQEVLALLRRVNSELGTTIIIITHEMQVIRSTAHRVGVLDEGKIVEIGDVYEVFSHPKEAVTKRFVSTVIEPVPTGDALEELHRLHHARLVALSFTSDSASQPEVYQEFYSRGVTFELVYGGVEDIQGREIAVLTLALNGSAAAIEEALKAVSNLVETQVL